MIAEVTTTTRKITRQEVRIIDSEGWEVIHSYSREQAIADGELIDVTSTAAEIGFKIPVALTRAVYEDCVRWDDHDGFQDEAGRLWDVLWMAVNAGRRFASEQRVLFDVIRVDRDARFQASTGVHWRATPVQLAMVIGPGDTLAPVITIMQPDED